MLTAYISKSIFKESDDYYSEITSKILLFIFEESILKQNTSSTSRYLNLISEMKNEKNSFFYLLLKKKTPDLSEKISSVENFLRRIEKISLEKKGLGKLYKKLLKKKILFDDLINILMASILISLNENNDEKEENEYQDCFASCLSPYENGRIQNILILLLIESKKCRVFQEVGLKQVKKKKKEIKN